MLAYKPGGLAMLAPYIGLTYLLFYFTIKD
jgi:hypothetical protein